MSSTPTVKLTPELVSTLDKEGSAGWETAWQKQVTPWDSGESAPVLVEYLRAGKIPEGRALVPGCGRGYDVATLASPTRFVLGIDLSPTAVEKAHQYLQEQGVPPSQGTVQLADFFETPLEPFDFIYDYTFMCALHPSMREKWALRMAELTRPGGLLFTLIFPVTKHEGGPPFAVAVEDMERLLTKVANFKCEELRGPISNSFPRRAGCEWVGLWRKP